VPLTGVPLGMVEISGSSSRSAWSSGSSFHHRLLPHRLSRPVAREIHADLFILIAPPAMDFCPMSR
jgi:hypothetical protein